MSSIEKLLEIIVYFIIFVKIVFLLSIFGSIFFKHYHKDTDFSKYLDSKFDYWNKRMEFVFMVSMALLLIFIFNPWYKHQIYISKEIAWLFYLFGIILILTSKWSIFIEEAPWYKAIVRVLD
jgi:uncharacterized membrane protein YiaA